MEDTKERKSNLEPVVGRESLYDKVFNLYFGSNTVCFIYTSVTFHASINTTVDTFRLLTELLHWVKNIRDITLARDSISESIYPLCLLLLK
jgi:hypothetical protein